MYLFLPHVPDYFLETCRHWCDIKKKLIWNSLFVFTRWAVTILHSFNLLKCTVGCKNHRNIIDNRVAIVGTQFLKIVIELQNF